MTDLPYVPIKKYWFRLLSAVGVATVKQVEEDQDTVTSLQERVEEVARDQKHSNTEVNTEIEKQKERLDAIQTTIRALKAQTGIQVVPRHHSHLGARPYGDKR